MVEILLATRMFNTFSVILLLQSESGRMENRDTKKSLGIFTTSEGIILFLMGAERNSKFVFHSSGKL